MNANKIAKKDMRGGLVYLLLSLRAATIIVSRVFL